MQVVWNRAGAAAHEVGAAIVTVWIYFFLFHSEWYLDWGSNWFYTFGKEETSEALTVEQFYDKRRKRKEYAISRNKFL